MRQLYGDDLHNLGGQLTDIAVLVAEAMDKAYRSFESGDVQLAEQVIAADIRIDIMHNELDDRAIQMLATRGAGESELRLAVGALRMSSSLERMGDLARHIAQMTRRRYPDTVAPEPLVSVYQQMAQKDVALAELVVDLFTTPDEDLVTDVLMLNEQINELHAGIFTTIAAPDWEAPAAATADATLASRFFERFADHGVSIAKKVQNLSTGTPLPPRSRPPTSRGAPPGPRDAPPTSPPAPPRFRDETRGTPPD